MCVADGVCEAEGVKDAELAYLFEADAEEDEKIE